MTLKFNGDLSQADAEVLYKLACASKNILEFGVGGSTQIFAQSTADKVTSVDTSEEWIETTKHNLTLIDNPIPVTFLPYTQTFDETFDFIFVDGVDELRLAFAQATWRNLAVGGCMAFHDTRRSRDWNNVMDVVRTNFTECGGLVCNMDCSNVSVVYKRERLDYTNWQYDDPHRHYGGLDKARELWQSIIQRQHK